MSKAEEVRQVVCGRLSDEQCESLASALSRGCLYDWCDKHGYYFSSAKGYYNNTKATGYILDCNGFIIKMPVSIHDPKKWECA